MGQGLSTLPQPGPGYRWGLKHLQPEGRAAVGLSLHPLREAALDHRQLPRLLGLEFLHRRRPLSGLPGAQRPQPLVGAVPLM